MIGGIKTIGIVGGGQLGRMMIPAIKQLGLKAAVLDPAKDAPCHSICDHHIAAGFNDKDGYLRLGEISDVVTYEFEHIDADLLEMIEKQGKPVYPSVESLRIIQDKYTQKTALKNAGIAVPVFDKFTTTPDTQSFILKSRRGGYDGKGNYVVHSKNDLTLALEKLGGGEDNLMYEHLVDFEREVSVIATRAKNGECAVYPISENAHKDSILDITLVPAGIPEQTKQKAVDVAKEVMKTFNGIGTFCVELFVTKDGGILVNEVAPRVHNSGHYTIEACRTSQFENHIRAIAGLGLGSTEMLVPYAAMKNIIGMKGRCGKAGYTGIENAMSLKNVNVHIYGKSTVAQGRKMGHITVTGTKGEVIEKLGLIDIDIFGNSVID